MRRGTRHTATNKFIFPMMIAFCLVPVGGWIGGIMFILVLLAPFAIFADGTGLWLLLLLWIPIITLVLAKYASNRVSYLLLKCSAIAILVVFVCAAIYSGVRESIDFTWQYYFMGWLFISSTTFFGLATASFLTAFRTKPEHWQEQTLTNPHDAN